MTSNLDQTVFNVRWLQQNEERLKQLIPQTLTHVKNFRPIEFGFQLKILGVNWHSIDELAQILTFFTHLGLIQMPDEYHIQVNPNKVFGEPEPTAYMLA